MKKKTSIELLAEQISGGLIVTNGFAVNGRATTVYESTNPTFENASKLLNTHFKSIGLDGASITNPSKLQDKPHTFKGKLKSLYPHVTQIQYDVSVTLHEDGISVRINYDTNYINKAWERVPFNYEYDYSTKKWNLLK